MQTKMSRTQSRLSGRISSTSRLSAKISVESAADGNANLRKTVLPGAPNSRLQKIVEAEESAMVVYAVREDLMRRVMSECHSRYLEKQTVKFLVDCACTALKQIIDLNFFVHDFGRPFYENHPAWSADLPPEPSPPDTWASGNVPVVTELDERPSEREVIAKDESSCSASVRMPSGDGSAENEFTTDFLPQLDELRQERRVSFRGSNLSDTFQVSPASELFEEEDEPEEVIQRQLSIFSSISECQDVQTTTKNVSNATLKGLKLRKLAQQVEVEKTFLKMVDVSSSVPKLPPIRADTVLRRTSSSVIEKQKSCRKSS